MKNTDEYFCGQPDIKVSDFSSIYFIKLIFFHVCYFYGMFCASSKFEWCGIEEVGSGSFSYVKKDTKSKCRMVVFFIKIYKQVIFQHECIVSPIQSASGNALHCAWHFHRRNSSVLAYKADLNVLILDSLTLSYFYLFDIHFISREFFFNTNVLPYVSCWSNFNFFIIKLIVCILNVKHIFSYIYVMNMYVWIWILTFSCLFETADIIIRPYK